MSQGSTAQIQLLSLHPPDEPPNIKYGITGENPIISMTINTIGNRVKKWVFFLKINAISYFTLRTFES